MHYLISLGLTLLLELPLAWILGVRRRDLGLAAAANLLTNPAVVLIYTLLPRSGILLHTVLPELWAVVTEAVIYQRLGRCVRRPVLLSLETNTFSYFMGLLLRRLL